MQTFRSLTSTGILALFLAAGCGNNQDKTVDARGRTEPNGNGNGTAVGTLAPAAFVEQAASGGMFEVQSSQLALEKQVSGPVRDIAQKMVDDHTKANRELETAARDQNVMVPKQLMPKHQQSLTRLRDVQGNEFERSYMQEQLTAHQEAVALFERASTQLPAGDLRDFAQETLPTLRHHLQMIRDAQPGTGTPGQPTRTGR